jgi:CRISPR/Cas system-associated protein Csx1
MFAQESVMEIQKEREAFQKFCEENFDFERHEQTYFDEQTQCYENDIGEDTESINMAWMAWQAAKAQAVPEGFVLIKDDTKTVVAIERMVEQQVEATK